MAELNLNDLTPLQLQKLQKLLDDQNRQTKKVDWDNMTDAEKAWHNRTIEPHTPDRPVPQRPTDAGWYPRVLYGKVNGQVVGPTVKDAKDEAKLRELHNDESGLEWNGSLLELGIETSPSKPDGHVASGWQHFGAGKPLPAPDPAVDVMKNPVPEPPVIPGKIKDAARSEAIKKGQARAKAEREAAKQMAGS
jgi:hypothetical protein